MNGLLRDRVRLELDGRVARLVLARADRGNALDLELGRALDEAVARLETAGDVRAVLLAAEGPAFCVGGDLRDFASVTDPGAHLAAVAHRMHEALTRLRALTVPVVCAVQGVVAGGGIGVALSADVVLLARSARLRVAYTAVGLSPDCGTSWHLARALGPAQALDLVMTNRTVTAEEALAMRLVSRVVADADLPEAARAVAAQLADGPTAALVETRRLVRAAPAASWAEHLADEAQTISRLAEAPDAAEGFDAFLGKRRPSFSDLP